MIRNKGNKLYIGVTEDSSKRLSLTTIVK